MTILNWFKLYQITDADSGFVLLGDEIKYLSFLLAFSKIYTEIAAIIWLKNDWNLVFGKTWQCFLSLYKFIHYNPWKQLSASII